LRDASRDAELALLIIRRALQPAAADALVGDDGDPELVELGRLDRGRGTRHRVDARLVLGEGDRVAEVRLAGEHHHHPVDPEGDPAVRRGSHRERVEQEPELRALLLRRQVEQAEHALLHVGLVDPEGAAAELVAVPDQVVRVRNGMRGVLVEAVDPVGCRPREGVVLRPPTPLVLVPLEHREVGDPEPRPLLLVDQAELLAQVRAQRSEDA
jgi:hypothetical protein